MKRKETHEELIIGLLVFVNRPLTAKNLIVQFQEHFYSTATGATVRQVIYRACQKGLICQVKIEKFKGFYCLPEWFSGTFLKEEYKAKIYESKQVRV